MLLILEKSGLFGKKASLICSVLKRRLSFLIRTPTPIEERIDPLERNSSEPEM
jgi:hypothetical protein